MKFFLVDSRPSDTCAEQGRFPTAVNICPETLLCPDRMQQHEEMFESLRGAVHICVMGEGFSAVPALYGQKLSPNLQELMKEDESRTNLCALFFVKKGFPFVSILEGGFAAAHAWLAREGPKRCDLSPSTALVDYDADVSLFAQLESAYREQEELANATTRERTQRAMQDLFDGSLASLTRNQKRLENLASEMEAQKVRQSVSKMFAKRKEQEADIRQSVSDIFASSTSKEEGDSDETKDDNDAKGSAAKDKVKKDASKPAEEGRFHIPFASLSRRKSATGAATVSVKAKKKEEDKPEPESPPRSNGGTEEGTGTAARIRSSFFTKKNAVADTTEEPNESDTTSPSPTAPAASPLAKLKQVAASALEEMEDSEMEGKAAMRNRFAGFGSALHSAASSAKAAPALKRNPFARFGGAAAVKPESTTTTTTNTDDTTKVNRFAGLNQFRMRVQGGGGKAAVEDTNGVATQESEESISFFDSDDEGVEDMQAATSTPTDAVFND